VNSVSGTRLGGCLQQCLPKDASLEVPLPLVMRIQATSDTRARVEWRCTSVHRMTGTLYDSYCVRGFSALLGEQNYRFWNVKCAASRMQNVDHVRSAKSPIHGNRRAMNTEASTFTAPSVRDKSVSQRLPRSPVLVLAGTPVTRRHQTAVAGFIIEKQANEHGQ
jgi:hypothetical protein